MNQSGIRIEHILKIARSTRYELENIAMAYDSRFLRFPFGCCLDASEELALRLYENGLRDIKIISGVNLNGATNNATHAWINNDIYTIDITADQFNYLGINNQPVIVTPDDKWHTSFFSNIIHESVTLDHIRRYTIRRTLRPLLSSK